MPRAAHVLIMLSLMFVAVLGVIDAHDPVTGAEPASPSTIDDVPSEPDLDTLTTEYASEATPPPGGPDE